MDEAQYQRGVAQFAQMVGRDQIDTLRQRFQALSPEFERLVMGTVGGEVSNGPGPSLRTRNLGTIALLAGMGRAMRGDDVALIGVFLKYDPDLIAADVNLFDKHVGAMLA